MRENKENKLSIKKIVDKKEKMDVQGQGCWDLTTISSFDRQYIASST